MQKQFLCFKQANIVLSGKKILSALCCRSPNIQYQKYFLIIRKNLHSGVTLSKKKKKKSNLQLESLIHLQTRQ